MTYLKVCWDGNSQILTPNRSYSVGRGQGADLRVSDPENHVSRHHLDLVFDGRSWSAVDRSSAGTFISGTKITTTPIVGPTRISLGLGNAPTLDVSIENPPAGSHPPSPKTPQQVSPAPPIPPPNSQAAPPPPPAVRSKPAPPRGLDNILPAPNAKPPDPNQRPAEHTIALSDQALRLELDDNQMIFPPGVRIVVGRGAECDVRTDDRLVSSQHCAFRYEKGHWWIEDLGSTRGTYIDGRTIKKPTQVQGVFHVGLGAAEAGAELRVVTAGTHQPPKPLGRRHLVLVGMLGLVAVLVAAVGVIALTGDDDETVAVAPEAAGSPSTSGTAGDTASSASQLDMAKQATVYLIARTDTDSWSGSGSFITEDIVLTNRHVAEDASFLAIGVSDDGDSPVEFRYEGEHLASHPYLDIALVRVKSEIEVRPNGDIVNVPDGTSAPPHLIPIGSSTGLRSGDTIVSLGFPAVTTVGITAAVAPSVSVARGEIAVFQVWPSCSNPAVSTELLNSGDCSQDGDLPRGIMLSTDLSGSGGSGGPVVADGKLVAVRYAITTPQEGAFSTGEAAISIPIEYFGDWLDANT